MSSSLEPPKSYTDSLFQSVETNNLSPQTQHWLSRVLYALDQKNVSDYCDFMVSTVSITFNNGEQGRPNLLGIEAARAGLTRFWQGFKTIRHEEICMLESGKSVVHEALNHYETLDGRNVTLRAVAVIDRDDDGYIKSLKIYSDQSPLWSA